MKSNIFKVLAWASVICAVSMFAACNDEDNPEPEVPVENYIYLDSFAHTFLNNDDVPLTVNVTSTSDWSTEISYEAAKSYYEISDGEASIEEWLVIDSYTDNSVVFKAQKNDGPHLRRASVTFTNKQGKVCILNVAQTARLASEHSHFYINEAGIPVVMSQKGKYASYVIEYVESDGENEIFHFDPVIVNLETGEEEIIERLTGGITRCTAISDTGVLVLLMQGAESSIVYENGDYHFLDVPGGSNYTACYAENISSDGTVIIGYASLPGFETAPAKWVNGEFVLLEKPDTDIDGINSCYIVYPRGISADKSIIYGTTWNYPNFMVVYWTEDNKMHYVAEETIEVNQSAPWQDYWGNTWIDVSVNGPTLKANNSAMSPNAKYIGYEYQTMTYNSSHDMNLSYKTTFYDMGSNTVLTQISSDSSPQTATNDGLMFYGTPSYATSRGYVYDINTQQTKTVPEWILENFGITVPANCVVTHVGEDMKSVLGFRQVSGLFGNAIFCYWYINAY